MSPPDFGLYKNMQPFQSAVPVTQGLFYKGNVDRMNTCALQIYIRFIRYIFSFGCCIMVYNYSYFIGDSVRKIIYNIHFAVTLVVSACVGLWMLHLLLHIVQPSIFSPTRTVLNRYVAFYLRCRWCLWLTTLVQTEIVLIQERLWSIYLVLIALFSFIVFITNLSSSILAKYLISFVIMRQLIVWYMLSWSNGAVIYYSLLEDF